MTYTFPCGRWLAKDMEDGAIERELAPQKALQEVIGKDGNTKTKELKIKDKLAGEERLNLWHCCKLMSLQL